MKVKGLFVQKAQAGKKNLDPGKDKLKTTEAVLKIFVNHSYAAVQNSVSFQKRFCVYIHMPGLLIF